MERFPSIDSSSAKLGGFAVHQIYGPTPATDRIKDGENCNHIVGQILDQSTPLVPLCAIFTSRIVHTLSFHRSRTMTRLCLQPSIHVANGVFSRWRVLCLINSFSTFFFPLAIYTLRFQIHCINLDVKNTIECQELSFSTQFSISSSMFMSVSFDSMILNVDSEFSSNSHRTPCKLF